MTERIISRKKWKFLEMRPVWTWMDMRKAKRGKNCAAKTQYRKFETNISRKGIARPRPNFHVHVSASDLCTVFPQSLCLFCCRKICGPILGIYKSLKDDGGNGDCGRAIPFQGIHKWHFRCSVVWPPPSGHRGGQKWDDFACHWGICRRPKGGGINY